MENVCKCTTLKSEFTGRSENRNDFVQKVKTVFTKLGLGYPHIDI